MDRAPEYYEYNDDDSHVYAELIAYDRVPEVYSVDGQNSFITAHRFEEVYRIALGTAVELDWWPWALDAASEWAD